MKDEAKDTADSRAGDEQARHMADEVARRSYGKLVALLAARTRDLAAAEDALSDAFVKALLDWPTNGCPSNPEGWLLSVARHKVIDLVRRERTHEAALEQLQLRAQWFDPALADVAIPDDRLALMFACAHPAIDPTIRAPLILQLVLGLNAAVIASAFLVAPATMGQRLVRAKSKIKEAGIPFRIPDREQLADRLDAVLDAIYATYAEGWADPSATDVARRDLAEEAILLGRLVTELMPQEPEALGLLALMFHAEARRNARRDADGEFVPLNHQDIGRWNSSMIFEAETLIRRASSRGALGRYQLEASLQSAHIYHRITGHSNWHEIVQIYDALLALSGSPVIAINRALALGEVEGPVAALQVLDGIAADSRLTEYQPYWAARAELLAKTRATTDAHQAYEIAIGLERDPAVRRFLQRRQAALKI
jgi:RNA polymerase sigma-70 factor (ECF subfamily)